MINQLFHKPSSGSSTIHVVKAECSCYSWFGKSGELESTVPIWKRIAELVTHKKWFGCLRPLTDSVNCAKKIWAWDEVIFIGQFYRLSSGILPNVLFDMKLCHAMLNGILKGSAASHFSKECTSVIRKDGSFKRTKKINYLPPHQTLSSPSVFESMCCKLERTVSVNRTLWTEDRKRDKISRGAL